MIQNGITGIFPLTHYLFTFSLLRIKHFFHLSYPSMRVFFFCLETTMMVDFFFSENMCFSSFFNGQTAGKEARWQLHKNAACNPEQVLAATPHKTPTVRKLFKLDEPDTKTIQVRRTRHAGHCWWSRDELIRDVLLWIPTHGRAKAGRPARTYIQQLCEDTGCCPEDLPRAMNDREEWRERVRDIRATSAIWWLWWFFPNINLCIFLLTSWITCFVLFFHSARGKLFSSN